MTDLERDAAIGRMVSRLAEAKKLRVALLGDLQSHGRVLTTAGNGLTNIASVRAYSDGVGYTNSDSLTLASFPPHDVLTARLSELETVSKEIRELRKLLKDAGIEM